MLGVTKTETSISITIKEDTPILYYYCQHHSGMGDKLKDSYSNDDDDHFFSLFVDESGLTATTEDKPINPQIQAFLNNDIASGNIFGEDVDSKYVKYNLIGNKQEPEMLGDAGYGTFTINSSGYWTYKLNNNHPAVNGLNVGNQLQDWTTFLLETTSDVGYYFIRNSLITDGRKFYTIIII